MPRRATVRNAFIRSALLLALLLPAAVCRAAGEPQPGAVVAADQVILTLRAPVASITPAERAGIVNRRIENVLADKKLDPHDIRAAPLPDGNIAIQLGSTPIVEVTHQDADAAGLSRDDLADEWAQRLRGTLLEVKPLYRASQGERVSFLPLLLVAGLAFLVPLLAARLRRFAIPVVVGEILVGIAIGRSGLGLVHYHSSLEFLAEFGFAYLLFISGLEVDFRMVRPIQTPGDKTAGAGRRGRSPVVVAMIVFGLTLALSAAVSIGLTAVGMLERPWLMMLVLSTTSLGLVVPILKERAMTGTPLGQTVLVAALMADFVTMFLVTIITGWIARGLTLKLFVGLLIFGVFLAAVRVGRLLHRSRKLDHLWEGFAHPTSQTQVRGSLALMLGFVAVAEQLGTEVILGAFLAGVLLALFSRREESDLHAKLEALGFGFFIPVFFIMVGVRFDIQALVSSSSSLLLAGALIVAAFAIQLVSSLPLRLVAPKREALAGGFLLTSRLSLVIATAEIGQRLGLFSEAVHSGIICVALVTCIGGPMGFQAIMPRSRRERRRTIIAGAGEYARMLAERLRRQGCRVTLMDRDEAALAQARAAGLEAVAGDARLPADLARTGVDRAEYLIAATDSDTANEAICRAAADLDVPHRVAVARNAGTMERLKTEGIASVTPGETTLLVLETLVVRPAAFAGITGDPTA